MESFQDGDLLYAEIESVSPGLITVGNIYRLHRPWSDTYIIADNGSKYFLLNTFGFRKATPLEIIRWRIK